MPETHDPVTLGSPRFHAVEHGPFQVTQAFFPARSTLPPHTHERTVVAVTLAGRWTSNLAGVTHESAPGYLLTEPAGDRHSNDFAAGGAHVMIVQPDATAADLLRPCLPLLSVINHRQSAAVAGAAFRLSLELRRADNLSSLAVQGICLELLSLAAREMIRKPRRAERWLTRVEDYLRDHFCPSTSSGRPGALEGRHAVTLQTLAAIADVHPTHLARAFRQRYGTSPAQFVRARRIEWAAFALSTTQQSIADIAQQAGFADQSHFTRLFHRTMGVTPARFRAETR